MTEEIEREVDSMCNLSDGVFEKGKMRERLDNLRSLMEIGFSLEQAMKTFKMDMSELEKYQKLLPEEQ